MTVADWVSFGVLIIAVLFTAPLGARYLSGVFGAKEMGRSTSPGDRIFLPFERLVYRLCGIDDEREQRWSAYAMSVLAFSFVSIVLLYAILRLQGVLPLNPDGRPAVGSVMSFNAAVSFVTNTNWQSYAGESTMSLFTQTVGLAVQNFLSAAVGLSVAVALIRGLVRRRGTTIGNFWVDLVRATVRVLLPLCLVLSVVFVSQGVVQNLSGSTTVRTVEGATQVLPNGGAMASQESIKVLGTNGGGIVNANSAHPYENPNGLTNWLEIYALLALPFSLALAFGRMAGDRRQGRVVFAAMFTLWLLSSALAVGFEAHGNPSLVPTGVDQTSSSAVVGGNLEGKELRIGSAQSGLFAAATTGTSSGAVDSSHDSYTPLGGMVPMVNMMLGEISPGGVGAGLYGMLVFVLLAVFLAGLMVGRTPEYLGKKIQASEMKLVVLYIVVVPVAVLVFAGASVVLVGARSAMLNPGPHGLSEVVYAFASAGNNNGSAFAGLTATNDWYQFTLAIAMLMGRFLLIVPVLAIAGSLVRKQPAPPSSGTFPTGTPLFTGLLLGVIVIVVGLTYFPVLALGPIVEHLGVG
jgi:K+-transporting ATPase ATPase A chain